MAADGPRFKELADKVAPAVQEDYRWLHRHPELSYEEAETARYVTSRLRALGYAPRTGVGRLADGKRLHGVVAVLGREKSGLAVALRADMDALPIEEQSGVPFRSEHPGAMHACGHDAHTAILLGAAEALRVLEPSLSGPVVFLFQPAEELDPGGAVPMLEDGALDHPPVGAIFGLHQTTQLPAGQMGFVAGPRSAGSDAFTLTVRGRGGHAAWPQRSVDAVVTACQIVVALQTVISRNVSPFQPAVLTIGTIHGGTKENIIAEEVVMTGTVRTLDPQLREEMPRRMRAIAEGVAQSLGGQAQLDYAQGYPVLVNEPLMTELARRAAVDVVGEQNVVEPEPGMGAEDFAYFLEKAPGCFAHLGSRRPEAAEGPPGHSARFFIDESCLPVGVAWYLALVTRYFAEQAP